MDVMVPLPEEFAARFGSEAELGRHVLKVLALNEYRAGRMSRPELQQVLGFGTRGEQDGFLKGHCIVEDMTTDDVVQELGDTRGGLRSESDNEREAAAAELVGRFKAFRVGKSLGGLSPKDLISEGRR